MYPVPKEPQKIRERIKRYERELRKEYKKSGFIDDSSGKRYWLGPLYMILGDTTGAIKSFEWFEETFPDDMGEPSQYLCWTLALYRAGNTEAAIQKLGQTMLSNLYLIPHLLGLEQKELDIWHASNVEQMDHIRYVPPEIFALWDKEALQWAKGTYDSPKLRQVRERYIEIYHQLKSEPRGPRRNQLVKEAFSLQSMG
jgi:tetratricopeptide (TPR) repeat protein